MGAHTTRTAPSEWTYRPCYLLCAGEGVQDATAGLNTAGLCINACKVNSVCARDRATTCRALPMAGPPADATAVLAITFILGLLATLPGLLMIHGGFARAGTLNNYLIHCRDRPRTLELLLRIICSLVLKSLRLLQQITVLATQVDQLNNYSIGFGLECIHSDRRCACIQAELSVSTVKGNARVLQ